MTETKQVTRDRKGGSPQPNHIARSVMGKLHHTRRALSPWIRRRLETRGMSNAKARVIRQPVALSTSGNRVLVSRLRSVVRRGTALRYSIGSVEPRMVARFASAIVNRFPAIGDKYRPRTADVDAEQSFDFVGTSIGSSNARESTSKEFTSMADVPREIMERFGSPEDSRSRRAKRASSVPKKPAPTVPRKMKLYSRVEEVFASGTSPQMEAPGEQESSPIESSAREQKSAAPRDERHGAESAVSPERAAKSTAPAQSEKMAVSPQEGEGASSIKEIELPRFEKSEEPRLKTAQVTPKREQDIAAAQDKMSEAERIISSKQAEKSTAMAQPEKMLALSKRNETKSTEEEVELPPLEKIEEPRLKTAQVTPKLDVKKTVLPLDAGESHKKEESRKGVKSTPPLARNQDESEVEETLSPEVARVAEQLPKAVTSTPPEREAPVARTPAPHAEQQSEPAEAVERDEVPKRIPAKQVQPITTAEPTSRQKIISRERRELPLKVSPATRSEIQPQRESELPNKPPKHPAAKAERPTQVASEEDAPGIWGIFRKAAARLAALPRRFITRRETSVQPEHGLTEAAEQHDEPAVTAREIYPTSPLQDERVLPSKETGAAHSTERTQHDEETPYRVTQQTFTDDTHFIEPEFTEEEKIDEKSSSMGGLEQPSVPKARDRRDTETPRSETILARKTEEAPSMEGVVEPEVQRRDVAGDKASLVTPRQAPRPDDLDDERITPIERQHARQISSAKEEPLSSQETALISVSPLPKAEEETLRREAAPDERIVSPEAHLAIESPREEHPPERVSTRRGARETPESVTSEHIAKDVIRPVISRREQQPLPETRRVERGAEKLQVVKPIERPIPQQTRPPAQRDAKIIPQVSPALKKEEPQLSETIEAEKDTLPPSAAPRERQQRAPLSALVDMIASRMEPGARLPFAKPLAAILRRVVGDRQRDAEEPSPRPAIESVKTGGVETVDAREDTPASPAEPREQVQADTITPQSKPKTQPPQEKPLATILQRVTQPTITTRAPTTQLEARGWRFKRKGGEKAAPTAQVSRAVGELERPSSAGRSLEGKPRVMMERVTGRDLSDVKVHTAQLAPLNVQAASKGRDIFFQKGEDNFDTPKSLSLLGHEVTHVAQRHSGIRAKPAEPVSDMPLARVQPHIAREEAEADETEQSVMQLLQMAPATDMPLTPPEDQETDEFELEERDPEEAALTPDDLAAEPELFLRQKLALMVAARLMDDEGEYPEEMYQDLLLIAPPDIDLLSEEGIISDEDLESLGMTLEAYEELEEEAEEEWKPDLDSLARQVYPFIRQLLAVERERQGAW